MSICLAAQTVFAERSIRLTGNGVTNSDVIKFYYTGLAVPVLLKYYLKPKGKNNLYALGGLNYSYDLEKGTGRINNDYDGPEYYIRPHSFSLETGLGRDWLRRSATLGIEIRASFGLNNLHIAGQGTPWTTGIIDGGIKHLRSFAIMTNFIFLFGQ